MELGGQRFSSPDGSACQPSLCGHPLWNSTNPFAALVALPWLPDAMAIGSGNAAKGHNNKLKWFLNFLVTALLTIYV